MQLSPEMDAGPIYCQKEISLTSAETRPELYKKLAHEGAELLTDNLEAILNQDISPKPQNSQEATYCQLLTKEESWLKPSEMTAGECERQIRAFLGFPRSRLEINGYICIITSANVVKGGQNAPLIIHCKDNTFLSIERLIAPSGKSLDAHSFLRGYSS